MRWVLVAGLLASQTGCWAVQGAYAQVDETRARTELLRTLSASLAAARERGDQAEAERLERLAIEATRPQPSGQASSPGLPPLPRQTFCQRDAMGNLICN